MDATLQAVNVEQDLAGKVKTALEARDEPDRTMALLAICRQLITDGSLTAEDLKMLGGATAVIGAELKTEQLVTALTGAYQGAWVEPIRALAANGQWNSDVRASLLAVIRREVEGVSERIIGEVIFAVARLAPPDAALAEFLNPDLTQEAQFLPQRLHAAVTGAVSNQLVYDVVDVL